MQPETPIPPPCPCPRCVSPGMTGRILRTLFERGPLDYEHLAEAAQLADPIEASWALAFLRGEGLIALYGRPAVYRATLDPPRTVAGGAL